MAPGGGADFSRSRRLFLRRLGAAAALPVLGAGAWELWRTAESAGGQQPTTTTTTTTGARRSPAGEGSGSPARLADGEVVQTAAWVVEENRRSGDPRWAIEGNAVPGVLEGFADRVSALRGETVTLYVTCQDPTFHVEAYRMGWYRGLGARLLWRSGEVTGRVQPAPQLTAGINMVECHWAPSLGFQVGRDWPQGDYLLKLVASGGQQRYVPLCVRDDQSTAAYVIQNSVTTWQAYNWWGGGYCLYYGPPGRDFANRSRVVSFDRPYPHDWSYGASDFIGNELPMVILAEKLGLDVTYWTDLDFHRRPHLLERHRVLVSLGHDEYWSPPMFYGAIAARDRGVNLMVMGANACFRRIRMEASPLGPDRREICYKIPTEDPLYGKDNAAVTANWGDPPDARPETLWIGNTYQSNGVLAAMAVVDPGAWIFAGTGLGAGDTLAGLVGPEYDGVDPAVQGPRNLEVYAHTPVVAFGQAGYSDVTWYSGGAGAGVFASGTNFWINRLGDNPGLFNPGLVHPPVSGVTVPLTRTTINLLAACGAGPAGKAHPTTGNGNWPTFYPGASVDPSTASNYRTYWPA